MYSQSLGLLFVVISAIFFALSTVRLGRYSSQFDSLKLSTASTVSLGLFSITWVIASIIGEQDYSNCASLPAETANLCLDKLSSIQEEH
jgi:drug/metabolite transporter (DMT)-like permease